MSDQKSAPLPERPSNPRSGTSRTLVQQTVKGEAPGSLDSVSEKDKASPPNETTQDESASPQKKEDDKPSRRFSIDDIVLLFTMSIMIIWPWIFFGVVWALHGVRMNNHVARVVNKNPHGANYFVTLVGTVLSMIITSLFSLAIVRFAQEWVTNNQPVQVFHVTVLSALRHQNWPWGTKIENFQKLVDKKRLFLAILVVACIATFAFVTSSITSLLTPAPFPTTTFLTGSELDFASTDSDCLAFFDANPLSNNCDWQLFNGLQYTSCLGENQMVDVLESGRGNILSLHSNNTQSLTFSQLGNDDGLHFLGSIHGVLPIGPNGVPAFDTLESSPLSNTVLREAMLSYNYTLDHQGLTSNISCIYDTQSPIKATPLVPNTMFPALQVTSDCGPAAQVMTGVNFLPAINSNNTLTYWACQSPPNSTGTPQYFVYLRGLNFYEQAIGNITCNISPIQPGIFSVTYQSVANIFSLADANSSSPLTFTGLLQNALTGLGSIISDGQNWQANEVAESVITFGVKSFGLEPYAKVPEYLRLYEAMIQGVIDYEATYLRLIYSTVPNPPSSCIRTVNGSVTYEVIGWSVQFAHIGFLMPMTIINLASIAILIYAMRMARKSGKKYDPTDPRQLIYDAKVDNESVPDEWKDTLTFDWKGMLKQGFEGITEGVAVDTVKQAVMPGSPSDS